MCMLKELSPLAVEAHAHTSYEKSLFVNSLYRYVKKYSNDEKLLDEALKIIREFNKHSLIVTERHKIFKLKNR